LPALLICVYTEFYFSSPSGVAHSNGVCCTRWTTAPASTRSRLQVPEFEGVCSSSSQVFTPSVTPLKVCNQSTRYSDSRPSAARVHINVQCGHCRKKHMHRCALDHHTMTQLQPHHMVSQRTARTLLQKAIARAQIRKPSPHHKMVRRLCAYPRMCICFLQQCSCCMLRDCTVSVCVSVHVLLLLATVFVLYAERPRGVIQTAIQFLSHHTVSNTTYSPEVQSAPDRMSAGSKMSARFVAAITLTVSSGLNPSSDHHTIQSLSVHCYYYCRKMKKHIHRYARNYRTIIQFLSHHTPYSLHHTIQALSDHAVCRSWSQHNSAV
jgi:hypothetical protein